MGRNKQARQSAAVSAVLMLLLFLLPLAVIVPFREELFAREETVDESGNEPFVPGETDGSILLRVLDGETVVEMTLGEYLLGVVRAEMPASFAPEALKAQAAAARTYTMYKLSSGGNHGDTAHVCTDHTAVRPMRTGKLPGAAGESGRRNTKGKLPMRSGRRTAS